MSMFITEVVCKKKRSEFVVKYLTEKCRKNRAYNSGFYVRKYN